MPILLGVLAIQTTRIVKKTTNIFVPEARQLEIDSERISMELDVITADALLVRCLRPA